VSRIKHLFDFLHSVLILTFMNVIARECKVAEYSAGISPLPKEMIVLEEVVVTERCVRDD